MGHPSQAVHENQCPDCLYMELSGKPKFKTFRTNPHEVAIFLTINFNEQWAKLPGGGRVKFGLKSGELRLELTEGTIPYATRNLSGRLALEVQKERQSQVSAATRGEEQASIGLSLKKESEIQTRTASTYEKKNSYNQSNKFTVTSCQVTTKGSLTNPAWVFEVQTEEPVLKGLLSNVELATMMLSDAKWKVKATFEVITLKNVKLTETEGPLLRNASPEKRTALELGIAKLLLKKMFHPYLSCMELSYE